MSILRSLFLVAFFWVTTGCGMSEVTIIEYVNTDTSLRTGETQSYDSDSILYLEKSNTKESRILARFPGDPNYGDDSIGMADLGMVLSDAILAAFLNCRNVNSYSSRLLVSSSLEFTLSSTTEPSLVGNLQFQPTSRSWWQTATWERAHPFNRAGLWAAHGGDLDTNTPAVTSTVSGTTISFDITDYMKELIYNRETKPHYGFIIRTTDATTSLGLTQWVASNASSTGPRIKSTYTCIEPTSVQALTGPLSLLNLTTAPAHVTEGTWYLGRSSPEP